jgi:hypothetical protein
VRILRIEFDTDKFQLEIIRSGKGKVPKLEPYEIPMLPQGAYVLIGNNTPDYGGKLSGTGYVMREDKATHRLLVSRSDVDRRMIELA